MARRGLPLRRKLGLLAWLVIVLGVVLFVAGVVWHALNLPS